MRLGAASGRGRLADCPGRFEINVLIAHFSWAILRKCVLICCDANCRMTGNPAAPPAIAAAFDMHCSMIDRSDQMRTHIVLSIAVITLSAIVLGLVAAPERDARAQSTLEVPGPAQQNQPYIPPREAPPPWWTTPGGSDNGDTIQLLPPQWFMPQPQAAAPTPPSPRPNVAPSYAAPMTTQSSPVL